MSLSVALITYNEEKKLARTLEAVKSIANEIIIVDSFSTDNTLVIAKSFGAKVYQERWQGYGAQRNSLIEKCTCDWILMIDADEVLSPECVEDIKIQIEQSIHEVFEIVFKTVYFDREIKYGGWSGSKKIRLHKKGSGKFNSNVVHEVFETEKPLRTLKGNIYHYTYLDITAYLEKFNRYTSEAAKERLRRGKKSSILIILLRSSYKFFYQYILRLGFLDGGEGLILAYFSASYAFATYTKLREYNKKGITYEELC
ncbi:MAG: glycosyltransferase family 2 protein [Fusobacteria bacterium]|nr:glycosyltransferase family 2 protein [Fusobacteriota bacterium]